MQPNQHEPDCRRALLVCVFLVSLLWADAACVAPPGDGSAWWRWEGNGQDSVGAATLTFFNGAGFSTAKVGQGLVLDGVNDYAKTPASAGLDVGASPGFSVEAWINPANAAALTDLVEWNNGAGGIGVHLSTSTASTRDLYANLVDTAGVSHQVFSAANALTNNGFQYIALTYDKTTGWACLYVNGAQCARTNLGVFTPQTTYDFYVGTRKSGPFTGIFFGGVIDELSLYRRALSGSEVQAIYAAGAAGKCTAPKPLAILTQPQSITVPAGTNVAFAVSAQGTPPLQYQWLFNGPPLLGSNQSSVVLANVQPSLAGDYSVIVSDVSGSVTSAPATLIVTLPLALVAPPQSVMAAEGSTAAFSVAAQGTGPLIYQWFFADAPLAGAIATNLLFANVQPTNAGRYTVVVSDATHAVTSAPVVLNVLRALTPVITEFLAENGGPLLDEDGDSSDWIEIFNPGTALVNLLDWSLTDDAANLTKWRFPATNLGPNCYLLVFASGKDRATNGAPLHTNFKLNAAGEYLALVQPDGVTIASEFAPLFPPQRKGVSFGLAGGNVYFPTPSPGAANDLGVPGFVADTKFSTNRGFYFAPVEVTISCATPGATIVYTTNSDEPSLATGLQVPAVNATSAPAATLQFTSTTTLRATAIKAGFVPANIDTHTYIFPASVAHQTPPAGASSTWIDDPALGGSGPYPADYLVDGNVVNNPQPGYGFTDALVSMPTISIVTPTPGLWGASTGIYTRTLSVGMDWERRASVELIYPDGRAGFQTDAGLRIHGAVSRLNAVIRKHPLRLSFRSEYGASKLEYPLFGPSSVEQFDDLVLRACSTDAWAIYNNIDFLWRNYDATYQRDQWMRDAQLDMGHLSARGLYVQLYLNGLYWGLYNLTERLTDSFFADHLGGHPEDYDAVTDFDGSAHAGSRQPWADLLALSDRAKTNTDSRLLYQMQGLNLDGTRNTNYPVLLQLDNFIDYMALHIYAAAIDWPGRNWWAARNRTAAGDGFHFFVWDQEIALDRLDRVGTWGNAPANIEAVYEPNTPGQLYDGLRRDLEFKMRFADRLQKHLGNGGVLTVQSNQARWASRAAEMDHGMVGESARWGDAWVSPAYNRQNDWLRMSNFTQNTYWAGNLPRAWQRFKNVGLFPDLGAPAFNQSSGNVPADFQVALTHTNTGGAIYFTLDGSDPRRRGGALAGTAQAYSGPFALSSPTLVRARVKSGTNWSALVEAQFFPPQDFSKLQLSEIMYNPPKVGSTDGDEFEFLELVNTGTNTLDLSGVIFSSALRFTFTNETLLEAGQYLVLARNAAQFAACYPGVPLHGLYTGKLDNAGETITLALPSGATLFSVTYDNAAPWPVEADNTGLSLQRMNLTQSVTNPANWTAAAPTPGGPLPPALRDTDGDGLPDGWEIAHGLNPTVNDATEDHDGDGASNWQEFIAGTNPNDAGDKLWLQAFLAEAADGFLSVRLRFSASSNKTYSVLFQDVANHGAWAALLPVAAAPTNRVVEVTNTVPAGLKGRFYRLATP
jgi:hypothetical protein